MSNLALSCFALLSAWAIWWTWRGRYQAERLADQARTEASANRELANAARDARDLAHDLGNLVAVIHLNLQELESDWDEREKARERVQDVQKAAIAMYERFGEWGRRTRDRRAGSSAVVLGSLCGLVRRTGVHVEVWVVAPLPFQGPEKDMVRVLENLLIAASRESIRAGSPTLDVEMTREQLRIVGQVSDPEHLDERLYEEGGSFDGTIGRGLELAHAAAERIGWRIFYTVEDERLSFVVRRR